MTYDITYGRDTAALTRSYKKMAVQPREGSLAVRKEGERSAAGWSAATGWRLAGGPGSRLVARRPLGRPVDQLAVTSHQP